ncbi:hypothetical protein BOTCAL_0024g00090 [Botryotinia calthae]|uniref:Uncharacterized protein n=1 Tax=Botryotinia calthae TaxID=38488 RepID=A0A4Y8DEH3_9HELO|nr:hypothetical protein BOTCAL_0024g00090 [Botryotinia calthae]
MSSDVCNLKAILVNGVMTRREMNRDDWIRQFTMYSFKQVNGLLVYMGENTMLDVDEDNDTHTDADTDTDTAAAAADD